MAKAHPDLFVGEAGTASSTKAFNAMFSKQLAQAGERSIPLTLLVLLLVFGTVLAAWVPLLLALSSVIATTGLVSVLSHVMPVDGNVSAVILLVGLAVGVDYTLFYLKREREERAAGRAPRVALEAAARTSGRSVLISGITVTIAMAGMLFTRNPTFMGFAIATMLVVLVAMLGFAHRLARATGKARRPGRTRPGSTRPGAAAEQAPPPSGENRVWAKVLTPALKRPLISTVIATAALVTLALPVSSMHTAQSGLASVPRNTPTVAALNWIDGARCRMSLERVGKGCRRAFVICGLTGLIFVG